MSTVRIAQVGGRGFGKIHLQRIDRMVAAGRAELVALADPAGLPEGRDCPWYAGLDELLAQHQVDVVSIATPINTHCALASMALRAGADVMLEKPPLASMTEFAELVALADELGRTVQIGFQSFGSHGLGRVQGLLADGSLGELQRIEVFGAWVRNKAYYARSPWAGKRTANGHRVADGVCTNPLAHSIATACRIAGLDDLAEIREIETELYHAHAIEADDTSWMQIRPITGVPISVALCLTTVNDSDPEVTFVGSRGTARYFYTIDRLELTVDGQTSVEGFERDDLLENLLDHRDDPSVPLICPLESTGVFMAALEATQDRPEPSPITRAVEWVGGEQDPMAAHPVVEDVEQWMRRAVESGKPYSELGAPWATPEARHVWRP